MQRTDERSQTDVSRGEVRGRPGGLEMKISVWDSQAHINVSGGDGRSSLFILP